ncbi:nucleoside deaminase [Proteinivorax hydrogeniformans]|uniref:tRNA-specific adenosine deaminase n=1 Tax=Proteinivorax hydrogeniformans TaxID=1826727 RepID=A0AAU8HXB4_9FIRM
MQVALKQAQKALRLNEVPIGAVVVKKGEVISVGHNLRETLKDPTAHAEMVALRRAAQTLGGWRLIDCQIYVTVEPCFMCTSTIIQSRIKKVVFGASEPKMGGLGSKIDMPKQLQTNIEVVSGVCEQESIELLNTFFSKLRR